VIIQPPTKPSEKQPASQEKEPSVSGFQIEGTRVKSIEEIVKRFSEISFLSFSIEGDTLFVLNVESRNLKKEPVLFSVIRFKPDIIECIYTCLPNTSPKKRRLEVVKYFLNLLSLAEDCYKINIKQIYALVEATFSALSEYVSLDYEKLYGLYDNLKTDYDSLQKKVKELTEANLTLSKDNYELKGRNDELLLKLKSLETLPDNVLAAKIQEWIFEHKGEINISEFSKVYNVPETRVEQMLNKMVTEGYLETKG